MMTIEKVKSIISEFKDFPKKNINYKDITPILKNNKCFNFIINEMGKIIKQYQFDLILGIESRGFIFASALAIKFNKGLILARKLGKLPGKTISEDYFLEYNKHSLEIKCDDIKKEDKILIVDDVIATSGTINAAIKLIHKQKANIIAIISLILLEKFKSMQNFNKIPIHYLIKYND